jgi:hypothetical protein
LRIQLLLSNKFSLSLGNCASVSLRFEEFRLACKLARGSLVAVLWFVLEFSLVIKVSVQDLLSNVAIAKILKRPVLKHGPRSLTYVQVLRW